MNVRRSLVALVPLVALLGCPEGTPAKPTSEPAAVKSTEAPKPLVSKPQVADWCGEHGVPESVCTRCDEKLVAGYKAKNDWCAKHDLPDSQCFQCHPEHEAKWKALAPK